MLKVTPNKILLPINDSIFMYLYIANQ